MVHPLDPLTPEEISESSRIIRESQPTSKGWIFNSILLLEPPKKDLAPKLLANEDVEGLFPRKSFTLLIERESGKVFKVVVNITEASVEKFEEAESGHQPTLSPEDCFESERIVREDENVQKRCAKLGLTNMDLVTADPWSYGYNAELAYEGKRIVQLFMYTRYFEGDNHYAHPLDFVVVVDMVAGKVVSIEDLPIHTKFTPQNQNEGAKVAEPTNNYDPDLLSEDFFRKDVKPLEVLQPEGPSFTVNGNEIQWQKFKMRISFNYREGLVLHDVKYQDGDRTRPLFYRASLSEMVVPYGDPRPPFHRKCAFDIGDYGLGFCANSLELGCDCLGTIKYFDGVLNTHDGEPTVIKNAICLHEEDAGTLFKHTEYRTGKAIVARSRRLVLSFIVTVVNYEYAYYWTFYQDGTINFEVKATGELSTNMLASGADPAGHGTVIFPNVNGQFHQHIFCMRIDPMIDGLLNSIAVSDVKALEEEFGSEGNPYGQGFTTVETVLGKSVDVSDVQSSTSRFWKILNPSSIHPYTGKPVAWKLVPSAGAFPGLLAGPQSFIRKRAGFATHSVWVTQQQDEELYAGGLFINQSKGGDGVSSWVQRNENVDNEDIVLWHSFGVTHIPRVEDFPIMPVESSGFTLKPCNFFTGNPGVDVPSPSIHANKSTLADKCLGSTKCLGK